MPLTKLQFRPGINREVTAHTNEGGWVDCDKVRFRSGFPETIGGWQKVLDTPFLGICRALHAWVALDGTRFLAVGTSAKIYLYDGGQLEDITPLRATTSAGSVTFAATAGSSELTVTDTTHGAAVGDYVTFSGAVSLGDAITADVLNAEYQITAVTDVDTYSIDVSVAATSSDTGNGGTAVVGEYQISVGSATATFGTGWGAGGWGEGGWGDAADVAIAGSQIRIWDFDNYGEDLVMAVRNGGVYYWDRSGGVAQRAVAVEDLAGANRAPTIARHIRVSGRSRHVLAFGCDSEFDAGVQDPLLIRFSDQEDVTEWQTLETNDAGFLRLNSGSGIVAVVQTRQQTLVFTDVSLHAVQYVGAPFVFGVTELAVGTTIAGPNAAVAVNDEVFWMGVGGFYRYRGTTQHLPCTVEEYVFNSIDRAQLAQVYAGHNAENNEVWWLYATSESDTNDRYVVFNYVQNLWYYGTFTRTAWEQEGIFDYPIAAGTDNYLYYHEVGDNDGESNPPIGIASYIESSAVDIGEGDKFMFASRVIPDITFRGTEGSPSVTFTFKAQDWPGDGVEAEDADEISRTQSVPIEKFTREQYLRLRGRAMALRVSSSALNTAWRLGTPRIDIRTDGRH